jgi:hypothetical protein
MNKLNVYLRRATPTTTLTPVAACLVVFLTAGRVHGAGWYDGAWSSRKEITVDNTKVMATHADFPLLVSITGDDALKAGARSDGFDILFTDDNGTTKLDHEIEEWDDTNGDLVAWVRIPSLPDTVDKVIYRLAPQRAVGLARRFHEQWQYPHRTEHGGFRARQDGRLHRPRGKQQRAALHHGRCPDGSRHYRQPDHAGVGQAGERARLDHLPRQVRRLQRRLPHARPQQLVV